VSEIFPARTIAIEVLGCTEPSRVREFNRWYDKVHTRALKDIPGIIDVYRYLDVQPDLDELAGARFTTPPDMPARYLTLYRLNADDPWSVMQRVREDNEKKASAGELIDCLQTYEMTVWDFVAYRKSVLPPVRPETRLPDGMPEAILLVFGSFDPAHRVEHDDWWLYTHAHDLLETPGMTQCERYQNLNPEPAEDEARFLHIYEFDMDDPQAALRRILLDDKDVRRIQGRFSNYSTQSKPHASGLYRHWDLM
jgi:hypothetical protein